MSQNYIIQWKSRANGRTGRGTIRFEKEEAEQLLEELNREYPQIQHELVELPPEAPAPGTENQTPPVAVQLSQ